LRASSQIHKVKEVTQNVVKEILSFYDLKEDFHYQVTKLLVKKIREGY
jgi:hypothetical protein